MVLVLSQLQEKCREQNKGPHQGVRYYQQDRTLGNYGTTWLSLIKFLAVVIQLYEGQCVKSDTAATFQSLSPFCQWHQAWLHS